MMESPCVCLFVSVCVCARIRAFVRSCVLVCVFACVHFGIYEALAAYLRLHYGKPEYPGKNPPDMVTTNQAHVLPGTGIGPRSPSWNTLLFEMRKDGHILLAICLFLFENAICSVSVPFERGPGPWSEPGDPGLLKFQYYCKFRAPQVGLVAARSATLLVRFNQDVQDIVNWNMIITSPAIANRPAKVFVLTNEPNQDFTNFTWSFHAIWKGVIDYGPPVRSSPTEPTGKNMTEMVEGK
ncbi:hypothetical protein DPMN_084432 [Dreissena polymorpha]|uniref:Uncharacterized protein n=1 Tax=Dreissena polymorpha TaxID=45954 RepID=A0A9D3YB05_DREPO|nr:hypothetical protein DPMN_084432 [Dreissena polymorpha]